jgi:hypothetical protein
MFTGIAIKAFFSGLFAYVGALLTFLTTKPGVYLLMAGVAVGAYWYSGHEGYKRGVSESVAAATLAQARAEVAALDRGKKLQASIDAAMADEAFAAGVQDGNARTKTTTITKEIPVYVTVETDRNFPVPCGVYRVLNAANSGTDPATIDLPPGLSDDAACPIAASDIAALGVTVAGLYHQAEAKVIGLQALARTLAEAASK